MKSYIFITTEGFTYQPGSESPEPDVENCQVIGFAQGIDPHHAFQNLIQQNDFLLKTTFDEVVCYELKDVEYHKHSTYFSLDDYKADLSCLS